MAHPRLRVEARSPDGSVEAVSVINHPFCAGRTVAPGMEQ
ncbi:hypothetical protein ACLBR5_18975 [Escherichia coli]